MEHRVEVGRGSAPVKLHSLEKAAFMWAHWSMTVEIDGEDIVLVATRDIYV